MSKSKLLTNISLLLIVLGVVTLTSCAEKFELSVTGLSGGSVTMEPSGGNYRQGTVITLTATEDSGYAFTGWGNISGYSQDYSMNRVIEIDMPAESIEISANFAVPNEGWTFMIYMSGDQTGSNSLSPYVSYDLNEIEKGLYDAVNSGNNQIDGVVRVLVLADRSGDDDTSLYLVKPDNTFEVVSPKLRTEFNSDGELNMGDPESLKNFTAFCLANYPSVYNALILWNHGGGVKSLDFTSKLSRDICYDENDNDILYLNEVQTSIEAALGTDSSGNVNKLDIIGMDACIMGEVETAYEMQTVADYFVGSMAEEWGSGWGYNYIFNKFTSAEDPSTPAELADILVTQYQESTYAIADGYSNTMTAVKIEGLENLKTQIDALAKVIHSEYETAGDDSIKEKFESVRDSSVYYFTAGSEYETRNYPYHDIYSFCEELIALASFGSTGIPEQAQVVLEALASTAVASYGYSNSLDLDYYETTDADAIRGLSILIPHGEEQDNNGDSYYLSNDWYTSGVFGNYDYGEIDFCTYNSNGTVETWRELFEAWYGDPGTY